MENEVPDDLYKLYIDRAVKDAVRDASVEIKNDLLHGDLLRIQPLKKELAKISNLMVKTRAHYLSERFTKENTLASAAGEITPDILRKIHEIVSWEMAHLVGQLDAGVEPFKAYVDWNKRLRAQLSKYLSPTDLDQCFPDESQLV